MIGIPFHFGQDKVDVARGPQALFENGFANDLGKYGEVVLLPEIDFHDLNENERRVPLACKRIHDYVLNEVDNNDFLLNIGGDHGLSVGTISAVLEKFPNTIVIWVDAHGDINTPLSSVTKNFHGMPLSYLLGLNQSDENYHWIKKYLMPKKIIYFGVRDLDDFERDLISELEIQCFSPQMMNEMGIEYLLAQALKNADPNGDSQIHLSFDLDVFDSSDFLSTGLPLPNGPSRSDIFKLLAFLGHTGRLISMDLVEYHPRETDNQCSSSYKMIVNLMDQVLNHLNHGAVSNAVGFKN